MDFGAMSGIEYAQMCAVQLWGARGFLGSGFFVAPRMVMTCAHVVHRDDAVQVRWRGQELSATVVVRDPTPVEKPGFYPFPDVAFLFVEVQVDNPSPFIDYSRLAVGASLQAFGFSLFTPDSGVATDTLELKVVGDGGRYVKVLPGGIAPGLSGAAAVDPDTGRICGMVKAAASQQVDGAFIVPGFHLRATWDTHRSVLTQRLRTRSPLVRTSRSHPMYSMLQAQRMVAQRFPYRLAPLTRRRTPGLTTVYVEQRAQARRPADAPGNLSLLVPEEPVVITPHQMIRRHRNALVVGPPGGGKSTLLLQLTEQSAAWWLGLSGTDSEEPVFGPVMALRTAATDLLARRPWFESLAFAVNRDLAGFPEVGVTPDMFRAPPVDGAEWLILVDGLDEVLDTDERQRLIDILATRVAEYGTTARFVVTSRRLVELEFDRLRSSLATADQTSGRLGEYTLRPFDNEAFGRFADNWFRPPGGQPAETGPDEFRAAVARSRLGPLVSVPLLATIAAVVFEEGPVGPLPMDRTGLYDQFVQVLLTGRRHGGRSRQELVEQAAGYLGSSTQRAERLLDLRLDCVGRVSLARLTGDRRSLPAIALDWLRENIAELADELTLEHARELLLTTGLVAETGNREMVFTHQSLAEHLAARTASADFRVEEWLDRVRAAGVDSFALFSLAFWVRVGNDPSRLARRIVGGRPTAESLNDLASIIEDGGALSESTTATMLSVAVHAARQTRELTDRSLAALNHLLAAVVQRAPDVALLDDMVRNRRLPVLTRVEAARVMCAKGSAAEHRAGLEAIVGMAYEEKISDEDRLWAQRTLADLGGDRERPHAVQRLTQCVETTRDEAVRLRALTLLAGLAELPAAITALVRRAADPRRPLTERMSALDVMFVVIEVAGVDEFAWRPIVTDSTGWQFTSSGWAVPLPRDAENRRALRESHYGYTSRMGRALVVAARADPRGAGALVDAIVHDRTFTWQQRVSIARHLRRTHPELTGRAMAELAQDREESATNRVLSRFLFNQADEVRSSDDRLQSWAMDATVDLALRRESLNMLAGRAGLSGATSPRFLIDFVRDPTHPRELRRHAAMLLGWHFDRRHLARSELATMAREPEAPRFDRLTASILALALAADRLVARLGAQRGLPVTLSRRRSAGEQGQ